MTVVNVMVDTETFGTVPGCDLRSIGAVVFDPATGTASDTEPFYIATDNPRGYGGTPSKRGRFFETGNPSDRLKYPLKRDPQTEQWWSEQSAEAQAAFENPVDLRIALSRFSVWLVDVCPDVTALRLWAHGSHFDIPILAAAYEAVGLPVPWHYRAPRDTRTAFDMAGIDDHSAWLAQTPGPLGVPHHALDDAICQARAVCAAYERLRNG